MCVLQPRNATYKSYQINYAPTDPKIWLNMEEMDMDSSNNGGTRAHKPGTMIWVLMANGAMYIYICIYIYILVGAVTAETTWK